MRIRALIGILLVAILVLALTGSAVAQRPGTFSASDILWLKFATNRPDTSSEGKSPGLRSSADVSAAALGQPGFNLAYQRQFGELSVPYFDDANHLNHPDGVFAAGNTLWIAECEGRRALKYATDTGAFQMKIGKAGYRHPDGQNFDCIRDVAVDSGGNIWLADAGVDYVAKYDSTGKYVSALGTAWQDGSGNNQFNEPSGVAFDTNGNIYVSDTRNHRIQVFDSSGSYLATIGVTGSSGSDNNHFNRPRRIVVDNNNRLFVADTRNHRVQIFDVANPSAPTYIGTLGTSGESGTDNAHLSSPEGVAVDLANDRIYVADTNNNRVQVFNYTTQDYQNTLWVSHVDDVAVDADGNLYVAESWESDSRVRQFNSNLNFVRTYGTSGVPYLTDGTHFNQPRGLAVAPDGSIYIGEIAGRRLIKLNANGVPQWTRGQPGQAGSDNNHFTQVHNLDIDSAGRVYAVDKDNCRVQIYSAGGSHIATLGTGCGTGNYQFDDPRGVAIGPGDTIYVADTDNQRIQVFNASRSYIATIGQTGVAGSDNAHFDTPYDVDVDAAGTIYVADKENHRVQIFNARRVYMRTIGETGFAGDDFEHLNSPSAVAVDQSGRIYVGDKDNGRVQVFDRTGAYLTTVGGWGERPGQMQHPEGVAVDTAGNLYVAERENHRVEKFSPGVAGWVQININGFGDRRNSMISALAPFQGQLYAGALNWSTGAQLWRTGSNWTPVRQDGFGNSKNVAINHLIEFKGQLYAGTWADETVGGEVWCSMNGTNWTRVVSEGFGDKTNGEVFRFAVFNGMLYASTWSYTRDHGAEIWRSATGNSSEWQRVVSNGFGDANTVAIPSFEVFNNYLYAGTYSLVGSTPPYTTAGARVLRTDNGTDWTLVSVPGFGEVPNANISALAAFKGYLYASTSYWGPSGAQIWRCQTCDGSDWQKVVPNGFGDANNNYMSALEVLGDALYCVVYNGQTGMEVWRSENGTTWSQVNPDGFGDSNNIQPYWDNSVVGGQNRLYVGTRNTVNGGEVWLAQHERVYLPVVRK